MVGRIGRPHGVKGEVSVEPRTDEPERRFAVGSVLSGRTPDGVVRPEAFRVVATRWHQGRLLVRFEGLADRTAAEAARGTMLEIALDPEESPADPEEFYDHQLVGLAVEGVDGRSVGTVTSVEHNAAQDLLHLSLVGGRDVLFPFVTALVPVVDVAGGRIVVDDVPGLLDPDGTD
ncbi:ribosome maturation factor RimM [Nocardioides terrisoli]|uniref:ribosome maturation factor RimM n=1 Tax=Nocardioides terrisoli TaxID=3388267 RepID=UPI00287B6795|nr:ribosome maturation factor RimM [Nocardioides marmorisolisilvae]